MKRREKRRAFGWVGWWSLIKNSSPLRFSLWSLSLSLSLFLSLSGRQCRRRRHSPRGRGKEKEKKGRRGASATSLINEGGREELAFSRLEEEEEEENRKELGKQKQGITTN